MTRWLSSTCIYKDSRNKKYRVDKSIVSLVYTYMYTDYCKEYNIDLRSNAYLILP